MKGTTWNESRLYNDPVTLRSVRQITTQGTVNTIPSYHTGQSFTADGEYVIFISIRCGKSALYKAHLSTGDITCLIEPVDGIGGVSETGSFGNGKGLPIGPVISPKSRWAYYVVERQIRAVNIDTLDEKLIVNDVEDNQFIESLAISPDEKNLVYIADAFRNEAGNNLEYTVYRKHLELDGQAKILHRETGIAANHIMYNPMDSDLLLFCRDKGPSPAHRINENSRCWIYKISEDRFTEVKTLAGQNFQTHAAWTWNGSGVVYHGLLTIDKWEGNESQGGWYIGLAGMDGNPIREYSFPGARYYGHVSAMKGKNAAIIDGNILSGLLMWVYFDEDKPKIEIIARHDTDFIAMPGQYSHPHSICDPTGRWIVFNSARRIIFASSRSDIFSVSV